MPVPWPRVRLSPSYMMRPVGLTASLVTAVSKFMNAPSSTPASLAQFGSRAWRLRGERRSPARSASYIDDRGDITPISRSRMANTTPPPLLHVHFRHVGPIPEADDCPNRWQALACRSLPRDARPPNYWRSPGRHGATPPRARTNRFARPG